jgi:hypothetical protein
MCRQDLTSFASAVFRVLEPSNKLEASWHLGCIAEHLTASYNGELPRLIINIPPRCLKSVMVAQVFPAWVLGQNPATQFIGASYAHSLAERNVMACRRILQSELYRRLFPATNISQEQNQKDYFTTGMSGQYKGTGIGGTITGFGADYLIVDDPISPNEGASPTVRATANSEIRQTLFSRFNDKRIGRFVMIMQRVHENDPTGNLMEDGNYYLLKLPAEAKTSVLITLGGKQWNMAQGDLLTPRLPRETLDELRIDLQENGYAGQYLQEPIPVGGGEFKLDKIQYYPTDKKNQYGNIFILCDAAGGDEVNKRKKKTSDYTTMMVIELGFDNNYYLVDGLRDRLNPTERVNALFKLHRKWNEKTGKPPKVGYEKYGIMTDTHYIKVRQDEENYRFPVIELGGKMPKEERIRRMLPDIDRNRWYFPEKMVRADCEGKLIDLVLELVSGEMASFPRARFDDMLDAITRIYDEDMLAGFPMADAGNVKSIMMRRV